MGRKLPGSRRNTCKSHNENRQESHFNCKAFVNVSAEMISEFFEQTDTL
jgi:hypothetical protein